MSRRRRFPLLLALVVGAAVPAAARYALAPSLPWTRSISGGDTADAIGIDAESNIWVGGTTRVNEIYGLGRDLDFFVYSHSVSGKVVASFFYDRVYVDTGLLVGNTDEGPPAMSIIPFVLTGGSSPVHISEVYLTFTTQLGASTDLTTMIIRSLAGTGTWFHEDLAGGQERAAPAISVPGSGSPFECGTITAGGVDQMFFVHQCRATNNGSYLTPAGGRVSATYWSGSLTESVTGRAVAADGAGNAWVVAQQGGDLMVQAYTPVAYAEGATVELKATPMAGYPKRLVTAAWDEPWAAARDVTGALWVAGDSAGDAAIWKFGADGALAAGFPVRFGQGPNASLRALVPDGQGGCLATGRRGTNLLFLGVDAAGVLRPGFPVTDTASPDTVDGRAIVLDTAGSAWIAATVTAAPATWGGTVQRVYRYDALPEALPVSAGEVKVTGPGGAVLNLRRVEALSIYCLPPEAGDVRVRLMTLRGEAVREWVLGSSGNRLLTVIWDGTDQDGRTVATGTYAVRVVGGGVTAVKRVVVLRRP